MLNGGQLASLNAALREGGGRRRLLRDRGGLEEVRRGLEASPETRRQEFGDNAMPERRPRGFLSFVWARAKDANLLVLAVSAVVSLVLGVALPERYYDRDQI